MLLRPKMSETIVALSLVAIFLSILKARVENPPTNTHSSASLLPAVPQRPSSQIAFHPDDWVLRR
jgi:hypothetical protein